MVCGKAVRLYVESLTASVSLYSALTEFREVY